MEWQSVKVWRSTAKKLRILSALQGRSIGETLEELVDGSLRVMGYSLLNQATGASTGRSSQTGVDAATPMSQKGREHETPG